MCYGDVSSFVHRVRHSGVLSKVYKMRHTYRNRKSNIFDIFHSITFTNKRQKVPDMCERLGKTLRSPVANPDARSLTMLIVPE